MKQYMQKKFVFKGLIKHLSIITKLLILLNLFIEVGDILGGLALTGLILSEPGLKMATFVQPSSCGGGDKRLCKVL